MGITTTSVSLTALLAIISAATDGYVHSITECQSFQTSSNQSSTELDLSSLNIPILRAECLKGFTNVVRLHLKNCKIQEIEHDAFKTMKNLMELDLSNNFLDHLPEDLFEHNKQLERVSLKNNKFTTVPYIAVPLKKLDLSRCHISGFNFTETLEVESLDLGHNMLQSLSPQDMAILYKVGTINLNNNHWKCGSQFDAVLCWSRNRTNTSLERMPIKCSTRKGNFISYTIQHREEFCEIHKQTTHLLLYTTVIASDQTHVSDSGISIHSVTETSLPDTSKKPTNYQSTTSRDNIPTSENPVPEISSKPITSNQAVDPILENTFPEIHNQPKSDQSIIFQNIESNSANPFRGKLFEQNSRKPKSEQSNIFEHIDSESENSFPENSNEPRLTLFEDVESEYSEKLFPKDSNKLKSDQVNIFKNADSYSGNSNSPTTYRKNNTVPETQEKYVTMWVIIASISWACAAVSITLLAYLSIVVYLRRPYKRINTVIT